MSAQLRRDSVEAFLRAAACSLADVGIDTARLDAEVLLATAWDADRTKIYLDADKALPSDVLQRFEAMLERRRRREPVAYIIGRREFWSLDFSVTPDVLIPRPETECLVEAALEIGLPSPQGNYRICDVGTGSGCIAIVLAVELREARLTAIDRSAAALEVAKNNAVRLGTADRIQFRCADLLSEVVLRSPSPAYSAGDLSAEALAKVEGGGEGSFRAARHVERDAAEESRNPHPNPLPRNCGRGGPQVPSLPSSVFEGGECFDAIVSNLPYVAAKVVSTCAPELQFEPRTALDGGADGLDLIRRLVALAPHHLSKDGWIFLEIGYDQGEAVREFLAQAGWRGIELRHDYQGCVRVALAQRPILSEINADG